MEFWSKNNSKLHNVFFQFLSTYYIMRLFLAFQTLQNCLLNPNLYRIFWHRSSSKLHNFSYSFLLLYNEAFWHIKQCKISTKVALDLISLPLDDLENYTKVPLSYCDISLQFVLEGAIKDFWGF